MDFTPVLKSSGVFFCIDQAKKNRYHAPAWRHRLPVRTLGSHPRNRGSIPLGATKTSGRHAVAIDRFCIGESNGCEHAEHPGPQGDSPWRYQLVARVDLRVTRLCRIPLRPQRAASLCPKHSCSLTPFGPRQMFGDPERNRTGANLQLRRQLHQPAAITPFVIVPGHDPY